MSAENKRRGTRFENELEQHLNDMGLRARRLPRAGSKDVGDVALQLKSGRVIVIEAKNVRSAWANMAGYLREADTEAVNYTNKYQEDTYPVVATKTKQKGAGEARVVMNLDTLIELLRWEGLA